MGKDEVFLYWSAYWQRDCFYLPISIKKSVGGDPEIHQTKKGNKRHSRQNVLTCQPKTTWVKLGF